MESCYLTEKCFSLGSWSSYTEVYWCWPKDQASQASKGWVSPKLFSARLLILPRLPGMSRQVLASCERFIVSRKEAGKVPRGLALRGVNFYWEPFPKEILTSGHMLRRGALLMQFSTASEETNKCK